MIIKLLNADIFPDNMISIIYDDECPVCSYYVYISHIEEKFGKVNLIKVRNNQKILNYLQLTNININEGMVVIFNKKIYFGSDAITIISILGKKNSLINNIIINIFKYRILSQLFYPILKLGRRILLFILGKKLI